MLHWVDNYRSRTALTFSVAVVAVEVAGEGVVAASYGVVERVVENR